MTLSRIGSFSIYVELLPWPDYNLGVPFPPGLKKLFPESTVGITDDYQLQETEQCHYLQFSQCLSTGEILTGFQLIHWWISIIRKFLMVKMLFEFHVTLSNVTQPVVDVFTEYLSGLRCFIWNSGGYHLFLLIVPSHHDLLTQSWTLCHVVHSLLEWHHQVLPAVMLVPICKQHFNSHTDATANLLNKQKHMMCCFPSSVAQGHCSVYLSVCLFMKEDMSSLCVYTQKVLQLAGRVIQLLLVLMTFFFLGMEWQLVTQGASGFGSEASFQLWIRPSSSSQWFKNGLCFVYKGCVLETSFATSWIVCCRLCLQEKQTTRSLLVLTFLSSCSLTDYRCGYNFIVTQKTLLSLRNTQKQTCS